jgi:hypothetical protein
MKWRLKTKKEGSMVRLMAGIILAALPAFAAAENTAPPGALPSATPTATAVDPALAPRIKFDFKVWDFGKVTEGPELQKTFRFTNKGKSLLKIESVHTSCGCTAAETEGRTEIPPGETGAIKVKYDTKGRPGPTSKNITVNTNDPNNQSVVLAIQMDAVRYVDVQPASLAFYGVRKGEARNQQVKVLGREGVALRVLSAKSLNGSVSVTFSALREGDRRGAVLDVLLPADRPIGIIKDEIIVATSSKKQPEISIPVKGEVFGRVQVYPKQVFLNGTTGTTFSLQVLANPPEGFKVLKTKAAKGKVNTRIRKDKLGEGNYRWWVDVSIPWLSRLGPIVDEVTITTNDPEQKTFNIPVSGEKTKTPQR